LKAVEFSCLFSFAVLRMHSDRKIGFAMGILLIGVVAALFFRHDPVAVTEPLSKPRRQELNQRLRDREIALYIPDDDASKSPDTAVSAEPRWTLRSVLEDMDQKNRPSPAPVTPQRSLDEHTSNRDSLDGYRTWKPGRGAVLASPGKSSAAEIESGRSHQPMTAPRLPAGTRPLPPLHSQASAPTEMLAPSTDADAATAAAAQPDTSSDQFDEHTVQFGETLSSIAERYLGSRNRYALIFEANRDRLASADRLKVGMTLRIPRRTAAAE
jgi:nucleoid-associated protein YgaU